MPASSSLEGQRRGPSGSKHTAVVFESVRNLASPSVFAAAVGVLVTAWISVHIITRSRSVLIQLLIAFFIAFALEPAVQWLHKRGWNRGVATLVVFTAMVLGTILAIGAVVPLLVEQLASLLQSFPQSVDEVNVLLSKIPLVTYQLDPSADFSEALTELGENIGAGGVSGIASNVLGAAGNVIGVGQSAAALIFNTFTVLIVSYYIVADGPRLRATLAQSLNQNQQREFLSLWEIAVSKTGGYIYSRLLLALLAAVITAVALYIADVPYPITLGVWMGVTNAFIPVVGLYIGSVLVVVVALGHGLAYGIGALVFITVYNQFENYLIAPKIQERTMDVHPGIALFSVVLGASLLGAVGALLALPATAIIISIAQTYLHRHELIAELSGEDEGRERKPKGAAEAIARADEPESETTGLTLDPTSDDPSVT